MSLRVLCKRPAFWPLVVGYRRDYGDIPWWHTLPALGGLRSKRRAHGRPVLCYLDPVAVEGDHHRNIGSVR